MDRGRRSFTCLERDANAEATPSSHDEDGDADFPPCVGWLGSGKEGSAAWISSLIWNPTAHIRRTMYGDDDASHRDISIVRQQPPEIYMGFPCLPCSLSPQVKLFPHHEGGAVRFRLFQVQSRRSKGEDPFLKHCFFDMFVLAPPPMNKFPSGCTSYKGAEVPILLTWVCSISTQLVGSPLNTRSPGLSRLTGYPEVGRRRRWDHGRGWSLPET